MKGSNNRKMCDVGSITMRESVDNRWGATFTFDGISVVLSGRGWWMRATIRQAKLTLCQVGIYRGACIMFFD